MGFRYDVFLSHSSADKPAVEFLARKLEAEKLAPFLDIWHLIPGRIWQQELEEALQQSRACAIFFGAQGLGPWVKQEMLVALDRGARDPDFAVVPVLLPGFQKPRKLPAFLAQRNWVEFHTLEDPVAFHRLVSGIRGMAPGYGSSGGGESIKPPRSTPYRCMIQKPEGYVPRQEYEKVIEALLSGNQDSHSVGITTALQGAGGFGKTFLAQQICFDDRIRERFPDGILWTPMGEDITPEGRLSRIRDLIRWWMDKEAPAFETVTAAGAKFRELIAASRVLVVVDDVWSPADVPPFQGLENGSALLITTRDQQTLPRDSGKILVDAMVSREAVQLLRSGLAEELYWDFEKLAADLGEWPLLLGLVNRQLRELVKDGLETSRALKEIREALDVQGFSAFDRDDPESRYAAASRAILVSVQRLSEKEREFYFRLAVFPEDVNVPLSVLQRWWGINGLQVRKLCRRLFELSLLRDFEVQQEIVRLHDVMRRVLIEQIGDQLSDLHCRLLDAFRPSHGSWSDLPIEEKYLWRNLAGHLLGAERKDELRRVLTDLSFLQAKLNATDVNALIEDYQTFVGEERELRLVRDALRLSTHVLARDRQQLASQLFGRLVGQQGKAIRQLLDSAEAQLRLKPRPGSMAPAGGPLIRTLERQSDGVNAVAVVDSRRAVSGSDDGTLQVWDLETGESLRTLEGHSGRVNTVAVVDGRRAVSGSDDGTLQVWDLETGEILRTLEGHSGWVNEVAMVDGRRVVSGSFDGTLRVWDLETGETLRTLEGHSDGVNAVAVVDGRRAVSGSDDRTLRVWDLETGETLRTLEGHSDGVNAVAVVDGRRVVSGSDDGTLRVWDLETGETLRTLEGHSGRVNTVAVVDGRRVVSGSYDAGTLRVWDLETGETLRTLDSHSGGVDTVAVVDGRRVVSGSDGTLRVWDLETGETLRTLESHSEGVNAVAVVDNRRVVSGSDDETLRVWDLETGETLSTLEGHSEGINAVAVVNGRQVVSGSDDGTLRVWDLETGETLRTLEGHSNEVNAVAVVDNRRVVSGSDDGTLWVWDVETGETLRILENHSGGVFVVAVVDGLWGLSRSDDGTLWVWDVETGETLSTLEGHSDGVNTVAVVDGRWAVSGSDDGRLRVLDLETGETLRTLENLGIKAVAVVDGRRAISGSYDGRLRVWDLETGETLRTLEGHPDGVNAVAVVDDRRAVSGSDDGTLRVWDLETGETLSTLAGHSDGVNAVSVVDDRRAVSGSDGGMLRVWDLETGETLALVTLDAPISALTVSLDSRILVAGDQAGKVHFLDWVEPE